MEIVKRNAVDVNGVLRVDGIFLGGIDFETGKMPTEIKCVDDLIRAVGILRDLEIQLTNSQEPNLKKLAEIVRSKKEEIKGLPISLEASLEDSMKKRFPELPTTPTETQDQEQAIRIA
ncbi:MAG: hypothetical protein HYW70_01220 [Candidatus Nealsonbacteria bacterium]|nr:hypothetical protein [Candidatus Nealsonbacteria bacterium]